MRIPTRLWKVCFRVRKTWVAMLTEKFWKSWAPILVWIGSDQSEFRPFQLFWSENGSEFSSKVCPNKRCKNQLLHGSHPGLNWLRPVWIQTFPAILVWKWVWIFLKCLIWRMCTLINVILQKIFSVKRCTHKWVKRINVGGCLLKYS